MHGQVGRCDMISRRTMMNDEIVNKSGNIAQLEKCKGSYLNGLQLFGKSKQFKTNGLQLYNGSTITLAPSNSSTGFTYATEYLLDVIKKLPAGVYSVSYTLKETGDLGTGVGKITLQDSLNNMLVNALNTFELTDDIKNKVEKVALYGRVKSPSTVVNFMLNAGNKPKSYEPYTGGIPAPNIEYIQDIVNAGKDGSIKVDVNGSNFLNITDAKTDKVSLSIQNNKITVEKLITTTGIYDPIEYVFTLKAGKYILQCDGFADFSFSDFGNRCDLYSVNDTGRKHLAALHERGMPKMTFSLDVDSKIMFLMRSGYKEAGKSYKIKGLRINALENHQWEQYKTPQKLALSTPNGFPSIWVARSGSYIDDKGQHWICDEIDLGRGKYVQRVAYETIDKSTLDIVPLGTNTHRFGIVRTKNVYKNADAMSNFARYSIWANSYNSFCINGNQIYYGHTEVTTAEEIKQKFEALQKIEILGQLAEPVEHDLTAEEVAAYKALHTYTGTTVLGNDAEVYMKATYRKFK